MGRGPCSSRPSTPPSHPTPTPPPQILPPLVLLTSLVVIFLEHCRFLGRLGGGGCGIRMGGGWGFCSNNVVAVIGLKRAAFVWRITGGLGISDKCYSNFRLWPRDNVHQLCLHIIPDDSLLLPSVSPFVISLLSSCFASVFFPHLSLSALLSLTHFEMGSDLLSKVQVLSLFLSLKPSSP